MRHEWTVFPKGPEGPAHLLWLTTTDSGGLRTNATVSEMGAEIMRFSAEVEKSRLALINYEHLNREGEERERRLSATLKALDDDLRVCMDQRDAALERARELEAAVSAELQAQVEISEGGGRMLDRFAERERKLREALAELLNAGEEVQAQRGGTSMRLIAAKRAGRALIQEA